MKTFTTLFASLFLIAVAQSQPSCNNFWAQVSPDGNHLYFSSDRHGNSEYDIYRSDIDGVSNLQRLTTLSGHDFYLKLSPDGSKVVFQNGGYDSNTEIYIMNSDGSNLTQLTNNSVFDGYPSFSPDGQKIVFSAWDNSQYPEIFTMNTDGSMRNQLTNVSGAYWQSAGVYNPAGDKIYFLEGFNADNHIVMMDTNGGNWVDITPPNTFGYAESNITFSPDGSQIVFFTSENQGYNNGGDLVIADSDGSNWNFITNSTNGDYYNQASFHPTNNKLYYTHRPASGNYQIHRMDTNGTNSVQLSSCSPVGMNEVDSGDFEVYPNPANYRVKISHPGAEEKFTIRLFDAIGNLVIDEQSTGRVSFLNLDVSGLPSGAYFVELTAKEKVAVEKLIISR
jgi:Tol biopolymer transport system component